MSACRRGDGRPARLANVPGGTRRIVPLVEVFNLGNADTVVGYSSSIGAALPSAVRYPLAADHPRRHHAGFLSG